VARLPQPGGDSGTWGDVLNDYLSQVHNADGTLKDSSVTSSVLAPNSVTNNAIASDAVNAANIADGSISNALIADGTIAEAKLTSAVQTKLNGIGDWNTLANKPAIIASGTTQATARTAISAERSKTVDIRDYITSGTTFNLAAVVAAMDAGNGICYIPPGDWTASTFGIGLNLGGSGNRFTYKFVGAGKNARILLPAGMNSGDYLLIANSSNINDFHAHPKVVFEDFGVDGTNSVNGSFFKANQRSFEADRIHLVNLLNGFYTTGYADVCSITRVYAVNLTAGGWVFTSTGSGDGIIIDQLFADACAGINLTNCRGAVVRSCVSGYHQFTLSDVVFEGNHWEGDQTTTSTPLVTFKNGGNYQIVSGTYESRKYRPTFSVNDNFHTSRIIFGEGVRLTNRIDDEGSVVGPTKNVDIDIVSLDQTSEIVFHSLRTELYGQSTTLASGGGQAMLGPKVTSSGDSAVQTVLTNYPHRLAGNFTLRYRNGSWALINSSANAPIAETRAITTPTIGIAAVLSNAFITSLTASTYYYKAWVKDFTLRQGSPSSEASVTTTSSLPVPRLLINTFDSPVVLRILRGTTSGTYTQYTEIVVAKEVTTLYDQGNYIAGQAWQAYSGTPAIPTSGGTGSTNQGWLVPQTGNAVIYASAAPTIGSWSVGDICHNTTPPVGGSPGWVCTTAGTPGTWEPMAVVSNGATLTGAQTLTNKTLTTPVINGVSTGTGVASAATVSTLAMRDSNANLMADNFIPSTTSTATAAGTTTLTVDSTQIQIFTGSTTQTVQLPTTGIVPGQSFTILNRSTGNVTINASDGSFIVTIINQATAIVTALQSSPFASTHWAFTRTFVISNPSVASTIPLRDGQSNLSADSFISGLSSIATVAGTTVLGVDSNQIQVFTGSTTQTITLPTTNIIAGQWYRIINTSSGALTVNSSGGNLVKTISAGATSDITALQATPTTAAHWYSS
jgi:hypothetical protein